jgi:spore germination protein (amino acid permease)
MYIVSTVSTITRAFPKYAAEYAGRSGWVSVILANVAFWLLLLILSSLFRRKESEGGPANLSDVYELAFGKVLSKALMVMYLILALLLFLLYTRYYAERLLAAIFPSAKIEFFVICMIIPLFIALRGRIEAFGRFSELAIVLFCVVFIGLSILLAPSVKLSNVLPVTYLDTLPILNSAAHCAAIMGGITMFLFIGDAVSQKHNIKKLARPAALFLGGLSALLTFMCISTLGAATLKRMPLPFFSATKLINAFDSFERLESLLLSLWIVSDFAVIACSGFVIISLLKKLSGSKEQKYFATPLMFICLAGTTFLCKNRHELETFTLHSMTTIVFAALFYTAPLLALITGRLRKKI